MCIRKSQNNFYERQKMKWWRNWTFPRILIITRYNNIITDPPDLFYPEPFFLEQGYIGLGFKKSISHTSPDRRVSLDLGVSSVLFYRYCIIYFIRFHVLYILIPLISLSSIPVFAVRTGITRKLINKYSIMTSGYKHQK